MDLNEYWNARDLNTGETWFSFCQRTGMDAVSIAFGQAWRQHLDEMAEAEKSIIDHAPKVSAVTRKFG